MHPQTTQQQGKRPRASSDTYTTLPARVARNNGAASRRASDATPMTRYSAMQLPSRVVRQTLENDAKTRPPSYHPTGLERISNRQRAFDALNGGRDTQPPAPARTYDSPTLHAQPGFNDGYPSLPRSSRDWYQQPDEKNPTATDIYLPGFEHYGYRRPHPQEPGSKPFSSRILDFFARFTQEPPLPVTPRPSRRGSFTGYATENEEAQAISNFDKPKSDYENDMLIRAMELNGDVGERDLLEADADNQTRDEKARRSETPSFKQSQVGRNNVQDEKQKHLSYKERRKRGKHRIVYNPDSTFLSLLPKQPSSSPIQ